MKKLCDVVEIVLPRQATLDSYIGLLLVVTISATGDVQHAMIWMKPPI